MVRLLGIFSLLFCFTASAAVQQGPVPQVNIGGSGNIGAVISTGAPALTTLWGSSYQGTNAAHAFYKNGVQYQVPSGKYFRVVAFVVNPSASCANTQWGPLYSLTAWNTGASYITLPGAVYCNSSAGSVYFCQLSGPTGTVQTLNITYDFPALSYPGYAAPTNAQCNINAIGYEVTGTAP